jgi:hypothetical protein
MTGRPGRASKLVPVAFSEVHGLQVATPPLERLRHDAPVARRRICLEAQKRGGRHRRQLGIELVELPRRGVLRSITRLM